ncbi:MAG: DegV family protein [Clostridia bacterium]|nr:DegV family protein [Clostridia bacterium]
MKVAISAESTIDCPQDLLEKFGIKTVPFTITLGDRSAYDGEITNDEIIAYVNENKVLPKTSAVNEEQFTEHFNALLTENDAVVHFSLSSELSVACANAKAAAAKFKNVFVVDSRSLSTGIALLAIYAAKLAKAGVSASEIYERSLKRIPFVQTSFELKRIDYLYKGGRCSALAYFGANLLKIRPQILVKNGKMVSGKKYRGNYEHVVKNYCRDVLEEFDNPDLEEAFVTYTTASREIVNYAVKALKDAGFKNVYTTRAGGTVTSHCGEDCLGILYINDGDKRNGGVI